MFLTKKGNGKLWDFLESTVGSLESFSEPVIHGQRGIWGWTTMKTLARFQRGRVGVVLRLWGNKVVGVSVGAPLVLGLMPEWEEPGYVDSEAFREEEVKLRLRWYLPKVGGSLALPAKKGRKLAVLMVPGSGIGDRDLSVGAT